MERQEAEHLVREALAAGVEWCGINVEAGRPMMGCDPSDEKASSALVRLLGAFETDRAAMDEALWDYALGIDVEEVAVGKRLIATLGGPQVLQ
jgi:hypothetical protein